MPNKHSADHINTPDNYRFLGVERRKQGDAIGKYNTFLLFT
jgi:hypothetical protein